MNKQNTIFINPKGILCKTIELFGKPVLTMIDICPSFDGYNVRGEIINEFDWLWIN